VPRLKAADADLDHVVFVDAVMPGTDGEEHESALVLPADAHLLGDLVTEHQAALVVLDAATSTIDSKLDGDRDRQMRQASKPSAATSAPHAYLAARLLGRQPVVGESPVQAEVHVHDEVGAVVVEKTNPFCVVADQCSSVPVHAR